MSGRASKCTLQLSVAGDCALWLGTVTVEAPLSGGTAGCALRLGEITGWAPCLSKVVGQAPWLGSTIGWALRLLGPLLILSGRIGLYAIINSWLLAQVWLYSELHG